MGDINTNIRIDRLESFVENLAEIVEVPKVHLVNQYATGIDFDTIKKWLTDDEVVILSIKRTNEMWYSFKAEVTNSKITFYFIKEGMSVWKQEMTKSGGWQTATDAGYMFIPTPTENDTGAVLTATGEGTVEWAL